jgi:hypothetical protein
MAYTPKFLLPTQIADESGGHQFDQQGKPLTSSKGAIGIAQVMPATGPQAAQLAGVLGMRIVIRTIVTTICKSAMRIRDT